MDCKIDYVSFSVPTRIPFPLGEPDNEKNAHMVLTQFLGDWWTPIANGHSWQRYDSKGFYHSRYFDADTKISFFVGLINKHVHVEVGGQALDFIRALGSYEDLLQEVGSRASRLDLAVDFETQDSVSDFIDNNYKGRFQAGGTIFSEDGETSYIGSWKGERFARVYRYHPPHPRSNKLRAEVVLRGDYAKQALSIRKSEGEIACVIAAHEPFNWQSHLWEPTIATVSTIKSQRSDKEEAGTLRWLNGDVAACIARVHNEDLQDAQKWFDEYVKPRLLKE